ncbi:MAG TPA: hydrogenase formation protein HypD [Rhodopila sp.]|nr:hydrogenase formation protein HypD [Rhodopila sp.]
MPVADAKAWLERIRGLELPRTVRVMNVCGGHERTIAMSGLRAALPAAIELIPGPGCPVCVCPEEDIHAAIRIAGEPQLILVAFGDMLRVPTNGPRSAPRSLEAARSAGADVRPVASPTEAVRIARDNPGRQVVFFAAGFETTTAPVAAMIAEGVPDNLSVLLSARRTWPVVSMLLDTDLPGFDALIAPGHVATVMGAEEWRFVPETHRIPTAIAGFEPASLLAGLYAALQQLLAGVAILDNRYPGVVRQDGNPTAERVMAQVLDVVDANWRGIGMIPRSGFALKPAMWRHDARVRFAQPEQPAHKHAGAMPPGCDCARVVLGRIRPNDCVLYGRACTPRSPVGPCMVSDEGACRIWWSAGLRGAASEGKPARARA